MKLQRKILKNALRKWKMNYNYFYFLIPILALCFMVFYCHYSEKKKEKHKHEKAEKLFKQLKAGEIDEDEYNHEMEFLDL